MLLPQLASSPIEHRKVKASITSLFVIYMTLAPLDNVLHMRHVKNTFVDVAADFHRSHMCINL